MTDPDPWCTSPDEPQPEVIVIQVDIDDDE